jgi:RecB family exonuclease
MSFSKLNTFENCPKRFYYSYIDTEALPQVETEQMKRGTRVHTSLEMYGRTGDTAHLTAESRKYREIVDKILSADGDKYYEHNMAITKSKSPCSWDAESLWLRGIADLLVVNADKAFCFDYKTGKPKDDHTQLIIFSLLTFAHFPEVETVSTGYLWLSHDSLSAASYHRSESEYLWDSIEPRLNKVFDALNNNNFPTRPTRLCGWCQAKEICPDAYQERRRR